MCESGGSNSALRRVSWFLVVRLDLQIICFSFERGALDRDLLPLNAGHAERGELDAGSLRLAGGLLTVFIVLGGQIHLEWGGGGGAPSQFQRA